jgi:hypothetical protein
MQASTRHELLQDSLSLCLSFSLSLCLFFSLSLSLSLSLVIKWWQILLFPNLGGVINEVLVATARGGEYTATAKGHFFIFRDRIRRLVLWSCCHCWDYVDLSSLAPSTYNNYNYIVVKERQKIEVKYRD